MDFTQIQQDGEFLLVTTDDWFYGRDGQSYRSIWGKAKVLEAKDILGLKPSNSANWYLQVGDNEKAVFIAGCRIHYAMICLTKPIGIHVYCVN